MSRLFAWLVRTGAFARKELLDVVRQPRLIGLLVLGPFAVLLLFGSGYDERPDPYRTLFVTEDDSVFADALDEYADTLGDEVRYEGFISSEREARRRLVDGEVDLVVVFPEDPVDTVLANEHPRLVVWHDEMDPIVRTAISFASLLAVDEINTQILAAAVDEGQTRIEPVSEVLARSAGVATAVGDAVRSGDRDRAVSALDALERDLRSVDDVVESSATVLAGLGGDPGDPATIAASTATVRDRIDDVRDAIEQGDDGDVDRALGDLETVVEGLESDTAEVVTLDPEVIVRPLTVDVETTATGVRRVTDFYAPSTVVLLLQHVAVSFGALSMVRERRLGITEVFAVSPASAGSVVAGKYLGYLLAAGAVGSALVALVRFVLDVPILGSLGWVAVVLTLVALAAIGLGLLVSLVSQTDTQAVQYAMLILLASLFFSGFFLSLDQLDPGVRIISWLLPVTYGIDALQDVMLRGIEPDTTILLALASYGGVAAVLTWILTGRTVTR